MSDKEEKTSFTNVGNTNNVSNEKEKNMEPIKHKIIIWNDEIENILNTIRISTEKYERLLLENSEREGKIYNVLMYLLIILGPISGILTSSFLSSNSSDSENNQTKYIGFFSSIISFSTGIISAITKFSRFDQKSVLYKSLSTRFMSLKNNIERQMILNRNDRCNPDEYLEYISKSYDDLCSISPLTPLSPTPETSQVSTALSQITVPNEKHDIEKGKDNSPISASLPDINKFSDPSMNYEMHRFYNS